MDDRPDEAYHQVRWIAEAYRLRLSKHRIAGIGQQTATTDRYRFHLPNGSKRKAPRGLITNFPALPRTKLARRLEELESDLVAFQTVSADTLVASVE